MIEAFYNLKLINMKKLLFILSLFMLSAVVAPAQLKKSLVKIVKEGREPGMPYKSLLLNNIRSGVYKNESELFKEEDVKKVTQKLGYRIVHMRKIGLSPSWAVGRVYYFPHEFWFVPESEWQQYQSEAGIRERNIVKKINEDITADNFPKEGEVYFFDPNYGCKKYKVKWTGNIVYGRIDGQGVGYMMKVEGDKRVYYTVKGTFQKGLPVGDVTYAVGNTWDNDADRDVKRNYKHLMNVSPISGDVAYFTKNNKKYGFINSYGKLISEPVYDTVKKDLNNGQFVVTYKNMDIVIDKSMRFVAIADGVTEVPMSYFIDKMFADVTSITLPKSVTKLGDRAFAYHEKLESIKILGEILEPGKETFKGCKKLRTIDLSHVFHKTLGSGTFKDCDLLTSVILPQNLTSIGENAFNGCKSLTTIVLPNTLESINKEAFKNCASLTSITIPSHVGTVGANCFNDCKNLTSANVSDLLIEGIKGKYIFKGCDQLNEVNVVDYKGKIIKDKSWYWKEEKDPEADKKRQEILAKATGQGLTAQDFFALISKKTLNEVRTFLENKVFQYGTSKISQLISLTSLVPILSNILCGRFFEFQ